jgi:hypothetical protein
MRIRIAAIEASHWYSLYDSAYLIHLACMPDVQFVGLQEPTLQVAAHRAAALGKPPIFIDYRQMLINHAYTMAGEPYPEAAAL